jgi:hypothetical protein
VLTETLRVDGTDGAGAGAYEVHQRLVAARLRRLAVAGATPEQLAAALDEAPQHEAAWAKGADGEREVGRVLDAWAGMCGGRPRGRASPRRVRRAGGDADGDAPASATRSGGSSLAPWRRSWPSHCSAQPSRTAPNSERRRSAPRFPVPLRQST